MCGRGEIKERERKEERKKRKGEEGVGNEREEWRGTRRYDDLKLPETLSPGSILR